MNQVLRIYWVTVGKTLKTIGQFVIHEDKVPNSSPRLLSPEFVREYNETREKTNKFQYQILAAPSEEKGNYPENIEELKVSEEKEDYPENVEELKALVLKLRIEIEELKQQNQSLIEDMSGEDI